MPLKLSDCSKSNVMQYGNSLLNGYTIHMTAVPCACKNACIYMYMYKGSLRKLKMAKLHMYMYTQSFSITVQS